MAALPLKKGLPRSRIVSSPRRPGLTKPVAFRLLPKDLERLDHAAKAFHRSRSQLIEQAVLRCLQDGIWDAQAAAWGIVPFDPSPPDELVQISIVLQGLMMAQDLFVDTREHPQAAHILLDARQRLDRIPPSASTRALTRVLVRLSSALLLYSETGAKLQQRRAVKLVAQARAGLEKLIRTLRCC